MDKVAIIGGGFSAFITQLLLSNRVASQIITPSNINGLLGNESFMKILRRDSLEINKPLGSKAHSYGSLEISLATAKLHDRLILGGNSKIWGGFFNSQQVDSALLNLLSKAGVHLEMLSFAKTGSISNNRSIGQLQDDKSLIIDASTLLRQNSVDEYVTSIKPQSNDCIQIRGVSTGFEMISQKTVLAIGPIQLIDLLYRSGYINNDDQITLSEYEHSLTLCWKKDPYEFHTSDTIIRYKVSRAIAHALGIQKNLHSMEPSKKWLQPYIDQRFGQHENILKLIAQDGKLVEIQTPLETRPSFGGSIHYCNMHINGKNINDFLLNISSNLIGIGMAFVKQIAPGPISSDILIDAANKLSTK